MNVDDKAHIFEAYFSMLADDNAPAFEREYHFAPGRRFRFDFAFVPQRIYVEVDGGQFAYRGGRHSTDADREKLNIAAELGWRGFRYSPQQLIENPQACIDQVCRALGLEVEKEGVR